MFLQFDFLTPSPCLIDSGPSSFLRSGLFMSITSGVSWEDAGLIFFPVSVRLAREFELLGSEEVLAPLQAISMAWVFIFLFYIRASLELGQPLLQNATRELLTADLNLSPSFWLNMCGEPPLNNSTRHLCVCVCVSEELDNSACFKARSKGKQKLRDH